MRTGSWSGPRTIAVATGDGVDESVSTRREARRRANGIPDEGPYADLAATLVMLLAASLMSMAIGGASLLIAGLLVGFPVPGTILLPLVLATAGVSLGLCWLMQPKLARWARRIPVRALSPLPPSRPRRRRRPLPAEAVATTPGPPTTAE